MSEPPRLLTICRHDPRKGLADLLETYTLLNHQNVPFSATVIGGGPLLNIHRRFARQLTDVALIGSVPNTKIYLKSADIFILPSIEEGGSSLAILEAMRVGLPIIATRIDGIPEDITHRKSGLLVPPHNSRALASAIRKLLKNPALSKRLGRTARYTYHQKHNPALVYASANRFLLSVLAHQT